MQVAIRLYCAMFPHFLYRVYYANKQSIITIEFGLSSAQYLCRLLAERDQALDSDLSRVLARHPQSIHVSQLTIQLLPSSFLFFIKSEKMALASSNCLAWMLFANSVICWIVSDLSKSSLFRWSKRMFRRFSVSTMCALYCWGTFGLMRWISASRIS